MYLISQSQLLEINGERKKAFLGTKIKYQRKFIGPKNIPIGFTRDFNYIGNITFLQTGMLITSYFKNIYFQKCRTKESNRTIC